MGQLEASESTTKMAKKSSASLKKGAGPKGKGTTGARDSIVNINDPKVQIAILLLLLGLVAVAVWCCCGRRRRRRSSYCS